MYMVVVMVCITYTNEYINVLHTLMYAHDILGCSNNINMLLDKHVTCKHMFSNYTTQHLPKYV